MPQPDAESAERLTIIVVRSGGIAGLSKQWRAEADADHGPRPRGARAKVPPGGARPAPPPGARRRQREHMGRNRSYHFAS